jgi:hypothetical protein
MTPQAQHHYASRVVVFHFISRWQLILSWAFIVGALGFCIAGTLTVFLGWQYAPADQWHAVNWGVAFGAIIGAGLSYREYRNTSR